jgi:hypothetical protein
MTLSARIARLEGHTPEPPPVTFGLGCPRCGAGVAAQPDPARVVATACACGAIVHAFTLTLGERGLPAGGAA